MSVEKLQVVGSDGYGSVEMTFAAVDGGVEIAATQSKWVEDGTGGEYEADVTTTATIGDDQVERLVVWLSAFLRREPPAATAYIPLGTPVAIGDLCSFEGDPTVWRIERTRSDG